MNIQIDGKTCIAEPGESILETARRNNIDIPSLCHHEALLGLACCRLCVVEIEDATGNRLVVASCVYPVAESVTVYTNTEKIKKHRRTNLTLLAGHVPEVKGVLLAYCREYGVIRDDSHMKAVVKEKCILCGLCVTACEALGNSAIQMAMRGIDRVVAPPFNEPSLNCIGCASCARVCPTDAIECESVSGNRKIWGKTFSLVKCAACGEPYATVDELDWLKGKLLDTELNLAYCPNCRRRVSVNTGK
jgi:NADH dehydrogenase/NADH:ubiquinone oxidoreductase subunit G